MSTERKANESNESLAAEAAGADDDVDDSSSSLKSSPSSSDEKKEIVTTPNTGLPMSRRSDGELIHMIRLALRQSVNHPRMRLFIEQAVEACQHKCGLDFKFPTELILLLAQYIKDDRVFYNTLTSLNKEIHQQSKSLLPLWPQKAFELPYDDESFMDFEFSSNSNSLLVHQVSLGPDETADTLVLSTFNVRSGISSKEMQYPFPVDTLSFFRQNRFLVTHSPSVSAICIYDVENELPTASIVPTGQGERLQSMVTTPFLMTVMSSYQGETNRANNNFQTSIWSFHLSIWDFESKQGLLSIPNFYSLEYFEPDVHGVVFGKTFILFIDPDCDLHALNFNISSGMARLVLRLAHVTEGCFNESKLNPKDNLILATYTVEESVDEESQVEILLSKLSSSGLAFEDGQPIIDQMEELCRFSSEVLGTQDSAHFEWFPCGQYLLVKPDDSSRFLLLSAEYDPSSATWSLCAPSDRAPAVRLIEKANQLLAMRSSAGWEMQNWNWRIAPNGKALAIALKSGTKQFLQLVSV